MTDEPQNGETKRKEFEMNDWNKRVSELTNIVSDTWQSLQYTSSEAYDEHCTVEEYVEMIEDFLYDNDERFFDDADRIFINGLLSSWVESEYQIIEEGIY